MEVCGPMTSSDLWFSRTLFWSVATVFVLVYSWATSRHRTFGRRANGLLVVDEATGERVSWGRAIFRTVAMAISVAPLGLGYWWALIDPQGRTWHAQIARTRVIST